MESFVNDESFDLIGAFTEAKSLYNGLSTSEKEDFKDCVYATYDSVDFSELIRCIFCFIIVKKGLSKDNPFFNNIFLMLF